MKIKNTLRLLVATLPMLTSLAGCQDTANETPQRINLINSVYSEKMYNGTSVTRCLSLNLEEEYFLWTLKREVTSSQSNFYFLFTYYGCDCEQNISEFKYYDMEGQVIEFVHTEKPILDYYPFEGSASILISFKDASVRIKNIIEKKFYEVECSGTIWVPDVSQLDAPFDFE